MIRRGQSQLAQADCLMLFPEVIAVINEPTFEPTNLLRALVARSGVLRGSSATNSLEASILIDTPLPEGVEFIHNRLKEWLASTYFLDRGGHAELVRRAHEEGFGDVCVLAAAAESQQPFADALVNGLLDRARRTKEDDKTKRRLRVVALNCSLVAPALSIAN